MFRRAKGSKVPSNGRIARAVASVMSPSGTFTYANDSFTLEWNANEQTYAGIYDTNGDILAINTFNDISSTLVAAIARVVSTPAAAPVFIEPKLWIRSASLQMLITNISQIDCEVTVYPWVARYDVTALGALGYASGTEVEEKAGVATALATPDTIGWTPFQSKAVTESFKLGKPRKVKLQGGQSFTFHVKDNKPLYVNWGRLGSNSIGANAAGFGGRSRGCTFTAKGIVSVDDAEPQAVCMTFGKIAVQSIRRYDWEAVPTPYHFTDIVPEESSPSDILIIQPQTGAVNNAPVSI